LSKALLKRRNKQALKILKVQPSREEGAIPNPKPVQVLSRNKKYGGNKNPEENPGLDGKHDGPREQSAH
jgi:hypothetical protein